MNSPIQKSTRTTSVGSRRASSRRGAKIVALVAAFGLVAAACGGDDDDDADDADDTIEGVTDTTTADDTTPGSDPPAEGEQVTLTLSYVNDPIGADVIAAFEEAHPNIDIDATIVPFSDYVNTIRLTMASDTAPDIAQYNGGAMRTLIAADHLLPLNEFEESMGWSEKFPKSSLDVHRTDAEAKRFGTDSLYAVPAGLSVTGIYYNKEIAADLGLEFPVGSIDELEAAFDAAVEADITPVYVGALDYNHIHWWGALLNVLGPVEEYRDWAYGVPGATIDAEGARAASDLINEWSHEGYIPSSANGTGAADAAAEFTAGRSLLHLDGNWQAAAFDEAMGDNVGFFLMPTGDGTPADVANGSSVSFSISARTEHPDEAATFLDFLASPEAAAAQIESGFVPVNADAAPDRGGVVGEINDAFAVVAANDGIMPFPDFPAPALLDLLTAGIQGLIADQMTTEQYLESLQDAWVEYVES
jgi:raffinose/stachyose/melibiose transport system substrate-binding protein